MMILMSTVSLDKNLAIDLVDTKIQGLVFEINSILSRWNYNDPTKFIEDAKKGVIEEAEDDAISLRNLLYKRQELFELKASWTR